MEFIGSRNFYEEYENFLNTGKIYIGNKESRESCFREVNKEAGLQVLPVSQGEESDFFSDIPF